MGGRMALHINTTKVRYVGTKAGVCIKYCVT